jgi:ABC-type Fe3+/spermidine/putrescine transport system ATPase subunit
VNLFDGVLLAGFNTLALRVAGLEAPLALPDGVELPEGSEAALAVRPEKMRLSAERPEGIAVKATVTSINYQGGISIAHLATDSGLTLKAQLGSADATALERGQPLWVSWDPADAVVLSR